MRTTYRLLPTDPNYLAMTEDDIEAEYWMHHYKNNPKEQENPMLDDSELDNIDIEAIDLNQHQDAINEFYHTN